MRANGARRSSRATPWASSRSIAARNRSPAISATRPQREALIERIGAADVFVHNLRADVPAKFGIDGATLTKRFPRLIYADLGAFGHAGPWKERPGYEPIIQAVAGLISLNGDPSGPEARIGVSIIDLSTGMWTAIGVLAAIAQRAATGRGSLVNTSLFESGLMWASNHAANYSVTGRMAPRQGTGHPSLTPYQAFECSDGPLMICPGNDRLWRKFAEALGHPEWPDEPRFKTNVERMQQRDLLLGMIADIMKHREPRLLVGQARCAGRAQRAAQHRAAGAGARPGGGTRHVRPALRRLECAVPRPARQLRRRARGRQSPRRRRSASTTERSEVLRRAISPRSSGSIRARARAGCARGFAR